MIITKPYINCAKVNHQRYHVIHRLKNVDVEHQLDDIAAMHQLEPSAHRSSDKKTDDQVR